MKKRLTRGEKWLFSAPLLILALAGTAWQWRKTVLISLQIPEARYIGWFEFSPDSQKLVVLANDIKANRPFGQIFDLETRSKICGIEMGPVHLTKPDYGPPAWSPNGKEIVSVAFSGGARTVTAKAVMWDASTGALKAQHAYPTNISKVIRYSPDGKSYIGADTPPPLFDAATGKRLNQPYKNVPQGVPAKSNESLGLCAINGDANSKFRVIDLKTSKVLWQPDLISAGPFEWHHDVLAVNAYGNPQHYPDSVVGLLLWDGKTRQQLPSPLGTPDGEVQDFSFNPAQSTIVYSQSHVKMAANGTTVATQSSEMVMWDYRAHRVLWRIETPYSLLRLDWSPDGRWLAAQSGYAGKRFLTVFDKNGNRQFERSPISGDQFNYWSPDSKQLAVDIRLTDTTGKTNGHRIEVHRFED